MINCRFQATLMCFEATSSPFTVFIETGRNSPAKANESKELVSFYPFKLYHNYPPAPHLSVSKALFYTEVK